MLMTADRCREANIEFAAVHDSYWTHACDIEAMNSLLREGNLDSMIQTLVILI